MTEYQIYQHNQNQRQRIRRFERAIQQVIHAENWLTHCLNNINMKHRDEHLATAEQELKDAKQERYNSRKALRRQMA